MFGPGVEQAITTYRTAPTDQTLLAALLLFGNTPHILHGFRADKTEAVGFDAESKGVVRVRYTEPFFKRDFFDQTRRVYRLNVT